MITPLFAAYVLVLCSLLIAARQALAVVHGTPWESAKHLRMSARRRRLHAATGRA